MSSTNSSPEKQQDQKNQQNQQTSDPKRMGQNPAEPRRDGQDKRGQSDQPHKAPQEQPSR